MGVFEPFSPSGEWEAAAVHWHAYAETTAEGTRSRTADRIARRDETPDAVLRTPLEVARWIEQQTRAHVSHREVYAIHSREWVSMGDEDDLAHLRRENVLIASRGDSIYTDIFSETDRHDLYVEAVTHEQCTHRCTADQSQ